MLCQPRRGWGVYTGHVRPIKDEPHKVRARVASADCLSGHADRSELLDHAQQRVAGNLQRIFVIHGEEQVTVGLATDLRKIRPAAEMLAPDRGQRVEL